MIAWCVVPRLTWTALLLTWSIFLLLNDQYLSHALACVSTVMEATSSMPDLALDTPDPVSVMIVALLNLAMSIGRQCMESLSRLSRATTSASIIGMNVLANCYCWNLISLPIRCCKLARGYVTARTQLSTKMLSEKYSDL